MRQRQARVFCVRSITLSLLMVSVFGSFILIPETKSVDQGPITPLDLVFLGSADDAIFFADPTTNRNYADSKAYCEAAGMSMASIKTRRQANLIIEAMASKGLWSTWYWTALRESRALSSYVWADNRTNPDASFFSEGIIDGSPLNVAIVGGAIYVNIVDGITFSTLYLYETWNVGKVLCQLEESP